MKNGKTIVLLIGGYGFFGERLARLLSTDAELKVIIAGRSLDKAKNLSKLLSPVVRLLSSKPRISIPTRPAWLRMWPRRGQQSRSI
jgi:glutamyl-tRNA reductase